MCVRNRAILPVYIHDILIYAPSKKELNDIVEQLQTLYEVQISDSSNQFLSVKLSRVKNDVGKLTGRKLSQEVYINSMLQCFGMDEVEPSSTPMNSKFWTPFIKKND